MGGVQVKQRLNKRDSGISDRRALLPEIVSELLLVLLARSSVIEVDVVLLLVLRDAEPVSLKVPTYLIDAFHLSVLRFLCIVFSLLLKSTDPIKNYATTHPIDQTSTLLS